jgi:hypothetical protein
MKTLLGCLLCSVLTISQSFAISGGPFGGKAQVKTTGNYAGVLMGLTCAKFPTNPPVWLTGRCGANSLGIFSLTVPKSGGATGPLVIFNNGQTYIGTIDASADPNTGKMNGQLSGHFTFQEQVLASDTTTTSNGTTTETKTYTTQSFSASAAGQMTASITASTTNFSTAGTRVGGKADVQFSLTVDIIDDDIAYRVSGFKQSDVTQ